MKLFYAACPPALAQVEIQVSELIAPLNLPTPRLLDVVQVDGRPGLIYERVEGTGLLQCMAAKPWQVIWLARQMADLHGQVHARSGAGLPGLRPTLAASIQQVERLPEALKQGVLRRLEELPDGQALCHMDFHPEQIMLTANGPVVLDWMTARQGDPLADVARTTLMLRFGQPVEANPALKLLLLPFRRLFVDSYTRRYLQCHPGLRWGAIRRWLPVVAAARLAEGIQNEETSLLRIVQDLSLGEAT